MLMVSVSNSIHSFRLRLRRTMGMVSRKGGDGSKGENQRVLILQTVLVLPFVCLAPEIW